LIARTHYLRGVERPLAEVAMSNSVHGDRTDFGGYVTTFDSVARRTPAELERILRFAPGSLASGYSIYALVDPIGLDDFEWKDQTAYSDGWHFDPGINEYVQRRDELRALWGKAYAYDEARTDAKLTEIE
jgi:hypothetical protein